MSDFYGHTELRLVGDDANGYRIWMRVRADGSTCEWQEIRRMTPEQAADEDAEEQA